MLLPPKIRMRAWPMEAAALCIRHVFFRYPLEKIYIELNSARYHELGSISRFGFVEEAHCRDHFRVGYERGDLFVLALHRSVAEEQWKRLL
jgi:hypothetical protein